MRLPAAHEVNSETSSKKKRKGIRKTHATGLTVRLLTALDRLDVFSEGEIRENILDEKENEFGIHSWTRPIHD